MTSTLFQLANLTILCIYLVPFRDNTSASFKQFSNSHLCLEFASAKAFLNLRVHSKITLCETKDVGVAW